VKNSIYKSDVVLIDGRPKQFYIGEKASAYIQTKEEMPKGHIPSAINIPWRSNLRDDGTFKTLGELRSIYEGKYMTSDGKVITYCSEGPLAASIGLF
jgi:thiosulfate/3-mercaptopyruvate sulfurtransferase